MCLVSYLETNQILISYRRKQYDGEEEEEPPAPRSTGNASLASTRISGLGLILCRSLKLQPARVPKLDRKIRLHCQVIFFNLLLNISNDHLFLGSFGGLHRHPLEQLSNNVTMDIHSGTFIHEEEVHFSGHVQTSSFSPSMDYALDSPSPNGFRFDASVITQARTSASSPNSIE